MPQKFGVDVSVVDTTQEHELGHRFTNENGKVYVYVKADATGVAAGDAVSAAASYVITAGAANAAIFGVANVAIGAALYGWVQVGGVVASAKVATGTASGALLSLLGAASARLTTVIAVAEGGATNHTAGAQAVRGKALAAESGNLASVYLFNQ